MLVLMRRVDESVEVADGEIVVRVLRVRGNKVWLGFEAARDISIHRQEVADVLHLSGALTQETAENG